MTEDAYETLSSLGRDPYAKARDRQVIKAFEKDVQEALVQKKLPKGTNVHYLKFTPELKRAAMKQGFPLFTGIAGAGLTAGTQE